MRRILAPLLILTVSAFTAIGQTGDNPTMDPTAPAKKKDPFGINPLQKDRPKDAKTEITAKKQATFDNASSVAEFEGNVVVKDPQFTLFCDRLKVTLGKDRKGLQTAEAIGSVTIVQENKDEAGKSTKSIGRAGKALYTPATGDVELTQSPSLQSGENITIGDPETRMVLNKDGSLKIFGQSKSNFIQTESTNAQ